MSSCERPEKNIPLQGSPGHRISSTDSYVGSDTGHFCTEMTLKRKNCLIKYANVCHP